MKHSNINKRRKQKIKSSNNNIIESPNGSDTSIDSTTNETIVDAYNSQLDSVYNELDEFKEHHKELQILYIDMNVEMQITYALIALLGSLVYYYGHKYDSFGLKIIGMFASIHGISHVMLNCRVSECKK
jgi:hypothetical protein